MAVKLPLVTPNEQSYQVEPMDTPLRLHDKMNQNSPIVTTSPKQVQDILKTVIPPKLGVHTACYLSTAGFHYTGNGDTTRCNDCGLEVSNWTKDMSPFAIHSEQKPECPFVRTLLQSSSLNKPASFPASTTIIRNTSISNEHENPSKRQKLETNDLESFSNTLYETNLLRQVRRRTFSHWPNRTVPSKAQMIEAGFFGCNVGDRVICIYCNLICQQWTPTKDDPCEVHKTLSPKCIYVKAKLMRPPSSSIIIVNERSTMEATSGNHSSTSSHLTSLRSNDIVYTAACNPTYSEIPKRHASFSTWSHENLPSVDDLVRAGFFYTGTKSIVTCFYCNGSLQNWGANDNPTIEHARWFPHCAYAKQLCGDDLYRKIQESKRAQQERAKANELKEGTGSSTTLNSNLGANSQKLLIPDESTLSRLVAARLDLPVSQRLLDKNFKLSIIKRCWEDQLRIKHDDFICEVDLYVACLILRKQIEHIDGKKENIIIPSVRMKQTRERHETHMHEQTSTSSETSQATSNTTDIEMTTSSQSLTNDSTSSQSSIDSPTKTTVIDKQQITKMTKQTTNTNDQNQSMNIAPSNPCALCLTEEKRLACIPCGHMATCVACGHSLRLCPICRREIEAFVRIYL